MIYDGLFCLYSSSLFSLCIYASTSVFLCCYVFLANKDLYITTVGLLILTLTDIFYYGRRAPSRAHFRQFLIDAWRAEFRSVDSSFF